PIFCSTLTATPCPSLISPSNRCSFSSHAVVVEPLGLRARKRQDLLDTWSKIIHDCISDAWAPPSDLVESCSDISISTFNIKTRRNRISLWLSIHLFMGV